MDFKVTVTQKRPGCYIVSPHGPIDTETHEALKAKVDPLLTPGIKALILDMTHVNYISSIGLGLVFRIKKDLEARGSAFVMVHIQQNVHRIFKAVRMISQSMFATLEEADVYLDGYLKDVGDNKI